MPDTDTAATSPPPMESAARARRTFTILHRAIRRRLQQPPRFVIEKSGERLFVPGFPDPDLADRTR